MKSGSCIVILDDDDSIHQVWQEHLCSDVLSLENIELVHLHKADDLMEWQQHHELAALYLIDYEFVGEKITGLDIINLLRIRNCTFLVTSHYDDLAIRRML